jgi:hypothetical protein
MSNDVNDDDIETQTTHLTQLNQIPSTSLRPPPSQCSREARGRRRPHCPGANFCRLPARQTAGQPRAASASQASSSQLSLSPQYELSAERLLLCINNIGCWPRRLKSAEAVVRRANALRRPGVDGPTDVCNVR